MSDPHDDDRSSASSGSDALAPGFLLAPPTLADPNFDKTLVLLAVHEAGGSLGFVVNRPSEMMFHALMGELEVTPVVRDRPVWIGGPVSGSSGFVLYEHAAGKPYAPGIALAPTISVTPSRDVLDAAAAGKLGGHFELLLGYAGWGPGQLDDELKRGGWLHAPFHRDFLFEIEPDARWQEAFDRLGVDPGGFMNVPGGAQA